MSSRRLLATSAVLLSILASLFAAGCGNARAATDRTPAKTAVEEPIRVQSAPVESRTLPKTLEVTGALQADESADVASERDGLVAELRVERGSFVALGTAIAVLDATEAKASLEEARSSLAWTTSEAQRYAELREKKVVAQSENQRKSLDLDTARARLTLAQKALDDCTIRAPFAGLITEKKISAGAFVRRGQAVAGLVKVDPLRAELAIPESAVSAVKVGQVVRLSVQTFPGQSFEGKIKYVGPALRSEARTLVVEAVVPNRDRLLKPGLFATAAIELPASSPALLAPQAAVVTDAGISRVFVLGKEKVAERLVALGARHGDLVEIRSGVVLGERVVLNPDRRMTDGLDISR